VKELRVYKVKKICVCRSARSSWSTFAWS